MVFCGVSLTLERNAAISRIFDQLAGMAGFEPANDGVKVRCLTAWLHPYGKKVVKKGIDTDSLFIFWGG